MKKIVSMLLLSVMTCLIFAACQVEVQEEKAEDGSSYYFYYIDKDETKLKRERYKPQEDSAEFMLQDLMQRLNNKALEGEAINLLPKDVVMNYQIEGEKLIIDANSKYEEMSRAREILVRAGVVKTFLQVPGIASVTFTINGAELTDSKGQPVGEMTNSTFVELLGSDKDTYRYDTLTLYFTDKTGKKLLEEKRSVYYKRSLSKARVALEQLAKGPMAKGRYPVIPENTGILDVTTSDNTCYVKFDHVFMDYALDINEQVSVYSVVNTLLSVTGAEKVQISVEGSPEQTFGENMPLYNFYEWNEKLIAAEEEEK